MLLPPPQQYIAASYGSFNGYAQTNYFFLSKSSNCLFIYLHRYVLYTYLALLLAAQKRSMVYNNK